MARPGVSAVQVWDEDWRVLRIRALVVPGPNVDDGVTRLLTGRWICGEVRSRAAQIQVWSPTQFYSV